MPTNKKYFWAQNQEVSSFSQKFHILIKKKERQRQINEELSGTTKSMIFGMTIQVFSLLQKKRIVPRL